MTNCRAVRPVASNALPGKHDYSQRGQVRAIDYVRVTVLHIICNYYCGRGAMTASNSYGMIKASDYMQKASEKILKNNLSQRVSSGKVNDAIVWRMQKQFLAGGRHIYGKIQSDLTYLPDKGGFVVGCQLGHLVRSLDRWC